MVGIPILKSKVKAEGTPNGINCQFSSWRTSAVIQPEVGGTPPHLAAQDALRMNDRDDHLVIYRTDDDDGDGDPFHPIKYFFCLSWRFTCLFF